MKGMVRGRLSNSGNGGEASMNFRQTTKLSSSKGIYFLNQILGNMRYAMAQGKDFLPLRLVSEERDEIRQGTSKRVNKPQLRKS